MNGITKSTRLRELLARPGLDFAMEAHNGLSARLAEEAGFNAIWGSGLTISAAMGVRDSNEASWTQVIEVLEFMSDATSVPILMDGDTGYGNFNNARRLVKKLCQIGIAGVAIEDKLFPKTNSFIGEAQPLADIEEFSGKIKAMKDSQPDPDFCVVARVEAFIAGWGLGEALRRAEAYHAAGADAILMHSKLKTPDEIFEFMQEWAGRSPVVLVPTTYWKTPTQDFRDLGASLVIWANHSLRSSITAMRNTLATIQRTESLLDVEEQVATVKEVFELQRDDELRAAEKVYLPKRESRAKGIVLAAGPNGALASFSTDRPKCMIDIRGRPLLHRLAGSMRDAGVGDIVVVRGFMSEAVTLSSGRFVDNPDFDKSGEVFSLYTARHELSGPTVISYGDILMSSLPIEAALRKGRDIILIVDGQPGIGTQSPAAVRDLVRCSNPYRSSYIDDSEPVTLQDFLVGGELAQADGEWIGALVASAAGSAAIQRAMEDMQADGTLRQARMPALLQQLLRQGLTLHVQYIAGGWMDVDDVFDLATARNMVD